MHFAKISRYDLSALCLMLRSPRVDERFAASQDGGSGGQPVPYRGKMGVATVLRSAVNWGWSFRVLSPVLNPIQNAGAGIGLPVRTPVLGRKQQARSKMKSISLDYN